MNKDLLTCFKVLFLLLALSASSFTLAQTTLTGKVTSADEGEPLPGVNVILKNTNKGTATDYNGNYTIEIPADIENPIIGFSFVGYIPEESVVGNRTMVDMELSPDLSTLSEIVVVGYGTLRKSDLTGSVASIDSETLTKIPALNAAEALQGKVAGVQVTSSSGEPGASPRIRIRGVGTFNNASPIFVVDGVILDDIDFLNANDIQSMEILKDASATAIYGNRGANGVVIITTKIGEAGQPTQITVNSEYSMQVLQRRVDMLSGPEYAEVLNAINPGSFNNPNAAPNVDWQDELFEAAPIQSHQVAISGASENNQYYFSLGYFGQEGIIPESKFERLTTKINNRFRPIKPLTIGTNLTLAPFVRNQSRNSLARNALRAIPTVQPFNPDGSFAEVPGVGNLLADIEFNSDNRTRGIRAVGNFFAEVKIKESITAKSSLGLDVRGEENETFVPVFFVSPAQNNEESDFRRRTSTASTWLWENTLSFDKEFNQHRINAVVGYTVQSTTNEFTELRAQNLFREGEDFRFFDSDNLLDEDGVDNRVEAGNDFSMISYLGRVNYAFDNRYLVTMTFRRDGSSKFLGDNRHEIFPAFALGWNVINEGFMLQSGLFSNLKLRASWGILGNERIDATSVFNVVNNNIGSVFGRQADEALFFGQTDGAIGNPDLRWEETEQIDIGLEFGLFDDRLTGEVDYFDRTTRDILVRLDVPNFVGNGFDRVFFNAGEVRNRGVELSLNWRDEISDELSYRIGVVATSIDNETIKVSGTGGSDDEIEGLANNQVVTVTKEGLPIGAFNGFVVDGIYQSEEDLANFPGLGTPQLGDLIYRDINNDGVLNDEDRTFIGSPIADYLLGLSLGLTYKQFDLSLDFQGQFGNEIYNIKETIRTGQFNFEDRTKNFWRPDRPNTSEPRPTNGGNNFRPSDRYVQDGSFVRLRNVTLTYNLPQNLLDKLKMNAAQVYARGTNVFTITDYTGYSNEIVVNGDEGNLNNSNTALLFGVDLGNFPISSIYTLGLNIVF